MGFSVIMALALPSFGLLNSRRGVHGPTAGGVGVPWRVGSRSSDSPTRQNQIRHRRATRKPTSLDARASARDDADEETPHAKPLGVRFTAATLSGLLAASPVAMPLAPMTSSETSPRMQQQRRPTSSATSAFAPRVLNRALTASAAAPELIVPSGASTVLDREETDTVKLFKEATPSVVFITNKVFARVNAYSLDSTEIPRGAGSGFVWDTNGHIVTNYHVVRGADDLAVAFQGDTTQYDATLLGYDEDKDVAVLSVKKPPTTSPPPIPLGRSSSLQVGQKVFAIGNPFGLDHTLTTGIVSGLGRELPSGNTGRPILNVVQTDAAINPGNSGGPLLDSNGRLVGINTAIASTSGSSSGVGFALPVDSVKGIVEQVIQFGKVTRPNVGVVLAPDGALRQLLGFNADNTDGVLILGVADGSAAAMAGIRGTTRDVVDPSKVVLGDVIIGFDDAAVKDASDLFRALDARRAGETVTLKVRRNGVGVVDVKVTLGEKVTKFGV
jgi:S1-C subfamily serine protease